MEILHERTLYDLCGFDDDELVRIGTNVQLEIVI